VARLSADLCNPVIVVDPAGWFRERCPAEWYGGPVEVLVDRDEIVVLGPLPRGREPRAFREETRDARMELAAVAEQRFGRKVSWGVIIHGQRHLFTNAAVPVMTRLRFGERAVLDTLIDAGVARSRSEALAWCVRLVERHQGEWIGQLREALSHVEQARAAGPDI
jgi:hypothetical protein